MGANLPGTVAFTAMDYAIIGGSSAAGFLVIIIIILAIRFMRRGYNKVKGKEDSSDEEQKSDLSVAEKCVRMSQKNVPLKDRSAFDNTTNVYDSGVPEISKNHRVYRDPQTGEEAIIYQPTNVTKPLSRGSRDHESVQTEQISRRSVYDYIDTENPYKIKRPNLGGTRNWPL